MTEKQALELFLLIVTASAVTLMAATWILLWVLDRRLKQRGARARSH